MMIIALLSWLKLSVYMAIVSVAIVLSFHLKSKPSKLGNSTFPPPHIWLLIRYHRKARRPTTRHNFLDPVAAVSSLRAGELHQDGDAV
jgi:hypothetical protein